MKIVFVRHGDPNYAQDCLTELGRRQAWKAAERVAREGIDKIYASTCGRAMETAAYAAERLGMDVTGLDFMREIGWGGEDGLVCNGHPWSCADDVLLNGGDLRGDGWREHRNFKNNRVLQYVDAIPPAFDRLLARHGYVREGRLYRCVGAGHETIAVYSHQGSSSVAISHLLGLSFAQFCALCPLELTSVSVISLCAPQGALAVPRIEILNDARHIGGADALSAIG